MLFSRPICILELICFSHLSGSQLCFCCHQGHENLLPVNPKLNLCLILCPSKTPLAVYAVLSLQLLHHPHQFVVFTPVCMLLVSRSELCTVTSAEKSCPRLIQYSISFLFNFSFVIPCWSTFSLIQFDARSLCAGHHQTIEGLTAITRNPAKKWIRSQLWSI